LSRALSPLNYPLSQGIEELDQKMSLLVKIE
jgi:hypothetical protein